MWGPDTWKDVKTATVYIHLYLHHVSNWVRSTVILASYLGNVETWCSYSYEMIWISLVILTSSLLHIIFKNFFRSNRKNFLLNKCWGLFHLDFLIFDYIYLIGKLHIFSTEFMCFFDNLKETKINNSHCTAYKIPRFLSLNFTLYHNHTQTPVCRWRKDELHWRSCGDQQIACQCKRSILCSIKVPLRECICMCVIGFW